MTDAPQPPVPATLDLSGLAYMPLNVGRLLASETWLLATGDEAKAAMTLWARAWHQVPAGSLPDDDRLLAVLSGAGPKWRKVKAMALRGFTKHSDGRLYHGHICKEAIEAYEKRVKWRDKKKKQRDEKAGQDGGSPAPVPTYVPGDTQGDVSATSPLYGTGRDGTGQSKPAAAISPPPPAPAAASPLANESGKARGGELVAIGDRVLEAAGIDPARWTGSYGIVGAWLSAGYDVETDILPAVRQVAKREGYQPPKSLNYFTEAIKKAHGDRFFDLGKYDRTGGSAGIKVSELTEDELKARERSIRRDYDEMKTDFGEDVADREIVARWGHLAYPVLPHLNHHA